VSLTLYVLQSYVDAHNITNYVIIPSDVQMAQQLSYLGSSIRPSPLGASNAQL
jgi:hypothetical protein